LVPSFPVLITAREKDVDDLREKLIHHEVYLENGRPEWLYRERAGVETRRCLRRRIDTR
jgi:hypothetical protein